MLPNESEHKRQFDFGAQGQTRGFANSSSMQGAHFIGLHVPEIAVTIKAHFQIAQIHEYIESLPDKYNTLCGQRGSSLSGGQQQRLVIARALLRQPELLLLDEATSALDAETEEAVVSALDRWKEHTGATLLIITHRIRTIRSCDAAIVLHQGKVSSRGAFGLRP